MIETYQKNAVGDSKNRVIVFVCFLTFSCFLNDPIAQGVSSHETGLKMSPGLEAAIDQASNQTFLVQIFSIDSVLPAAINPKLSISSQILQKRGERVFSFISHLNSTEILSLSTSPSVKFIQKARTPRVEFKQEGLDLTLNEVSYLHNMDPELRGTGMNISIKENVMDTGDIDFKNRISSLQLASGIIDMHATNMATISAGGGNSSPAGKGVAWDAFISSSDFAHLLPDPDDYFVENGISVQNHAYGTGIENFYGIESAAYDDAVYRLPWLVHVFSSGNSGDQSSGDGMYKNIAGRANLTGQFKQSKNTITVGASDSFNIVVPLSSGGPAYDGRIKPELVAYGHGGSSGAAAIVSGVSLLIQEKYLKLFGELPPASLIKATLINSALDINEAGPEYKSGYGALCAYHAIHAVEKNNFIIDDVGPDEVMNIPITIPAGMGEAHFTLAWTDPAAMVLSSGSLFNDLDIKIERTSSEQWYPWVLNSFPHADSLSLPAKTGVDSINNVEKITILSPEPGEYVVQISGTDIRTSSQQFSMVWQFDSVEQFQWTFPTRDDHIIPGKKNIMRWNTYDTISGKIEFRIIGQEWMQIHNDVQSNSLYFPWLTDQYSGLGQLRWSDSNKEVVSDTFVIADQLQPRVSLLCADSMVIEWTSKADADSFEILRMGEKHLEHYTWVNDTFFVEPSPMIHDRYYAVAPVYKGIEGPASNTIDYTIQGAGCILDIFYLRHALNGKAFFAAGLSDLSQIDRVFLEKKLGQIFSVVQTHEVDSTVFNFEGADLMPGINDFRLRVRLKNGMEILSQVERVYYSGGQNVLLFPNPVAFGREAHLITHIIDDFQLAIFDMQGKEVQRREHLSSPVMISTAGLVSGLYLLHIVSGDGIHYHHLLQVY